MSSIFVKVKNKQYGPLSKQELKKWVTKGRFAEKDLVWLDDEGEWLPAENVEQLKDLFNETPEEKTLWAIGGGKGGVGKTAITASLGIALATLGKEVVIVDADLGGSNLHVFMGILEPEYTYFDFYTMERESLNDILLDTPIENLKMISGACGTLGLANPKYSQKMRFIRELRNIDAQYILMDLGGGLSYNVMDFFLAAGDGIIISSPEPASVQETFYFLKTCLLRKLNRLFKDKPGILSLLDHCGDSHPAGEVMTLESLWEKIRNINGSAATKFETAVKEFRPKLILNMVVKPEEIKEGMSIKAAAAELLSIDVDYLGYIEHDETVRDAAMEMKPFIIRNPKSRASRSLAKIIAAKLMKRGRLQSTFERRKMRKTLSELDYPLPVTLADTTICSVRCFYWDDCEFQNGGHPCSVKHLEPSLKGWGE